MVDISPLTLILVGLCSGIGNAAGSWFFTEHVKSHAQRVIEKGKNHVLEYGIK